MVVNEDFVNAPQRLDSDVDMEEHSGAAARPKKEPLVELALKPEDVKMEEDDLEPEQATREPVQSVPAAARLFKTTDRLLGDIVNDISMFEIGFETGILRLATIDYASELSLYLQSHQYQPSHKFSVISNKIEFAPTREVLASGVTLIRGFLHGRTAASNPFQTVPAPVYNVTIKIKHDPKSKSSAMVPVRHGFYNVEDDELTAENRAALVCDYSGTLADAVSQYSRRELAAIEASVPHVIDHGTFISLATKALVRIEISAGRFTQEALENFEETRIRERFVRYSGTPAEGAPDGAANGSRAPTPAECFASLTRIIKGPLIHPADTEIKSIRADHRIPNVDAGIDFMKRHLHFTHNEEEGELFPPNVALPFLRESYIQMYLEALFFSRSPAVTLGDQSVVMHALHERADFGAGAADPEESREDSTAAYIALSSRYRYSDSEIKDAYNLVVETDPKNALRYFDHLCDVAFRRKTLNLKGYVSKLKNDGYMGYKDLCGCYQLLEIPQESWDGVDDRQLLQQYTGLLIVTESQAAKDRYRHALSMISKLRRSSTLANFLNSEPICDVARAYELLDLNDTVDDDLVITGNEVKKSDYPNEANLYDRALLTIAVHRRSFVLLDYVDTELPYLNHCLELDLSKSYEALGADPLATDFQVITIFQERVARDSSVDVRSLRQFLRHVGKLKKSKLITEFLKKGIVEPQFLPVENTPVGLNNIGNTCYLNSLLQYYFVIEPLRSAVLQFNQVIDRETFDAEPVFARRRIGSRTVGFKETERSYQFVYQLRDLFDQLIKSDSRCVTPRKEMAYLAFSPSTDEVAFQIDDADDQLPKDYSNMQLVPLGALEGSSNDTPITIGSTNTSLGNSVITLESSECDAQRAGAGADADVDVDADADAGAAGAGADATASAAPDLIDIDDSKPQSPQKRRLSSESFREVKNRGHPEDDEAPHVDVDVEDTDAAAAAAALPQGTTSAATCQISTDQMENALEMGRQQDVTECIQNVLFQLESAFMPFHLEEDDEQYDLVKELFYGKTKQILQPFDAVTCEPVVSGDVRTKEERFLSLLVNIGDHPKDLYDALDTYFTEDVISMDDGDVKRSLTITELPKILQIQIQRVQFDRERLMPVKSIEPIPFEERLYMDRYMETDDETIVRKRSEVFEWKRQISLLQMQRREAGKKVDGTAYSSKDGLTVFKNYLEAGTLDPFEGLGVAPETVATLNSVIRDLNVKEEDVSRELHALAGKIDQQFRGFDKIGYSLFAVFIHRGEASYGHYWIYIKDPKRNVYRKYNDEIVTEVPAEEVFNFDDGNTATPYFLVYVRDDVEQAFVDPLRRDVSGAAGRPAVVSDVS